jgi:pimeloyl-ACP methyl ester carboxylesterase
MATVTSRDGTIIGYDRTGEGPALIVVCGATQFRGSDPNLANLADLLSDRFAVVTYDRRGRGESTDTLPYAVEREIEDIAALVAAAGGRAALLGYSSAAAAGLPLDGVIAYGPPFVLPSSNFPPMAPDYVEALDRFTAAGDRGGAAAHFMRSVGMPDEAIEGMKATPFWAVMESIAPTIAYDGRVMMGAYYDAGSFPERWQRITAPVLVANGDASFPFMPAAAEAVAAALPNAKRRVLAGQGHGPAPEILAPVIAAFLRA